MYYYQHHIGDFIKDTANLDDHQTVTYLRMLWAYYTDEKPISGDTEDIAFAMRSDEKTVRLLLRRYFQDTPEGWKHNRCDRVISEYRGKSTQARDAANRRWKNADAMPTQCGRNADASEINADAPFFDANQETKKPRNQRTSKDTPQTPEPPGFTDFWSAYPRKAAKPTALSAYKKQKITPDILTTILGDIAFKSSTPDWQQEGGKYIPHPGTYLNQRRWEDTAGDKPNPWAGAI